MGHLAVVDPGFPIGGGMDIVGGHVLPRWVHFGKFYVKTKESGSIGGHASSMLPINPPMLRSYKKNKYIFTYIQSMLDSKFSVRMINLLGTSLRHSFITLICGLSRKECISCFTCEYFTLMTLALKKMLKSEIKKANWENRTLYFINMYVQIAMYLIKTWQNLYLLKHFQIYKADIHFTFFHFVCHL